MDQWVKHLRLDTYRDIEVFSILKELSVLGDVQVIFSETVGCTKVGT